MLHAFLIVIHPQSTRIWLLNPKTLAVRHEMSTPCLASTLQRDSVCPGPGPGLLPQQLHPEPEDQEHGHLVLILSFHLTGRWFKLSLAQCTGGGEGRQTKRMGQVDFISCSSSSSIFL